MRIFLISPVRKITEEEHRKIMDYVSKMEGEGHEVYFPHRDTDQNDFVGNRICRDNLEAIKASDEVHVWWTETSTGTLFDMGMSFALGKIIKAVNEVPPTDGRSSFNNFLNWCTHIYQGENENE